MILPTPNPHPPAPVLHHTPEDMTATVAAEVTLQALQAELVKQGQWLPIDPPGAEELTVRKLLDENLSGPRRFGFGTIREHLIGIRVRLAGGRVIKAGGKVVKNVAGYDLCKLFIGAQGTLGVLEEATFKLRPLPETEQFLQHRCATLQEADELIDAVMDSALTPVVVDLHAGPNPEPRSPNPCFLVLGFAGTREEVEWQQEEAGKFGVSEPATLDFSRELPQRVSVLPSKLVETIQSLGMEEFIARVGNGVIYYRGGAAQETTASGPLALQRRLKDAFDPNHALPEWKL